MPLKKVLLPPHLVSTSTLLSPASHDPDCTSTGCDASTGITAMSPGRSGATPTSPPFGGAERVDEERRAAEHRALESGEHATARLGLDVDAVGHRRHRAGLDEEVTAGRDGDGGEGERGIGNDVDLHGRRA